MMGKRSDFKRMKGDYYITPANAVLPLIPHVCYGSIFIEMCAGNGALVHHLESHGLSCVHASDIDPKADFICQEDALNELGIVVHESADFYITNPPWTREILHAIIERYSRHLPTWLLFDADWMHTKQAEPYLKYCHKIVSVGRVSWMGNGVSGKDNAAWYLFNKAFEIKTEFIGRVS